MTNWLRLSGGLALLSLSGSAWYVAAATVRLLRAWESIPGTIAALDRTVQSLPGQLLPSVLAEVDRQASQVTAAASAQVGRVVDLTDRRTGELVELTRGTLGGLNGTLAQVDASVAQLSASASKTLNTVTAAVEQDRPEVYGLLRDSRLAAAEFARSNIYVRQQLPAGLQTFQEIERHVADATQAGAKASQATQRTMEHLDTATKPLPGYFRIPLSITGAIAPTAAGAIGAASATGAFH